jgi:hypothetical protein
MAAPSANGLFRRAIAQSVPGVYFTDGLAADIGAAITTQIPWPLAVETDVGSRGQLLEVRTQTRGHCRRQ